MLPERWELMKDAVLRLARLQTAALGPSTIKYLLEFECPISADDTCSISPKHPTWARADVQDRSMMICGWSLDDKLTS